ncbi:hypothetical protein [Endozoicomonas sp. YOMI1]|uniref:hypothetical protein n=1 Tax=Endozoicomonas sp. YOMI1 TaxID=2828739 RepID=UPI002148F128|nr:hypothetical protein [Endozoicomonas sp. YOMI1]
MSNDQDFIAAVNKAKTAADLMKICAEGDENTNVPAPKPYPSAHKAVREIQQQIVQQIDPTVLEVSEAVAKTQAAAQSAEADAIESGKSADISTTAKDKTLQAQGATEAARDTTLQAQAVTEGARDTTLLAQSATESARDTTLQTRQQVETQIVPVHTDVIRTQQIIRAMTNGIQDDAGYAAQSAKSAEAARAATQQNADDVSGHHAVVVHTAGQIGQDKAHIDEQKASVDLAAAQVRQDKEHVDQQAATVNTTAQQVATDASTATASADDAQQILNTIGSQLITYATNLIRTQSVVVTNYAFK